MINDFPWFYIWFGFWLTLACIFYFLDRAYDWWFRVRVKDKINFFDVRVFRDLETGGVCLGFIVSNYADFPINFKTSNLHVRLGDKIPIRDAIFVENTIPAKGIGWQYSHPIQIDKIPESGLIEASIDFTINYGKVGAKLKDTLSMKKHVAVSFNKDGTLEGYTFFLP